VRRRRERDAGHLAYHWECFLIRDLDPWSDTPDGELRACHAHGLPAAKAGHSARRLLSVTYDEEGGGDG